MTHTRKLIIAFVIPVAACFWGFLGWTAFNTVFPTNKIAETTALAEERPPLVHDPALSELAKELGMKRIDEVALTYVDSFPSSTRNGEFTEEDYGEYKVSSISIKRGLDPAQERRTLAHEYLHYVWAANKLDTNDRLTSDLISSFAEDSSLAKRMAHYYEEGTLKPTEIFSFYCTESSDSYLKPYVLENCNALIDRSQLTMLR